MKYLLDTNTCIFLMKNRPKVVEHYFRNRPLGIAASVITLSELQCGLYNSSDPVKNGANLANFLIGLEVLDYDSIAAAEYGRIRARLRKRGTPVGAPDMLIAAHVKANNLILVTNNTAEFSRVDGLALEDWSHESDTDLTT